MGTTERPRGPTRATSARLQNNQKIMCFNKYSASRDVALEPRGHPMDPMRTSDDRLGYIRTLVTKSKRLGIVTSDSRLSRVPDTPINGARSSPCEPMSAPRRRQAAPKPIKTDPQRLSKESRSAPKEAETVREGAGCRPQNVQEVQR